MPTGYTDKVATGEITELRDFALTCARAFGALIDLRDAPAGAPIPRQLVANTGHHDDKLAEALAWLFELKAMTPAERDAAAAQWNAENNQRRQQAIDKNAEQRARYDAMIAQVEGWEGAPEGLKTFMLEQLVDSRKFDTDDDPVKWMPKPTDAAGWYAEELRKVRWDIDYHRKERDEMLARTANRNAWLAQLWGSLPADEPRND